MPAPRRGSPLCKKLIALLAAAVSGVLLAQEWAATDGNWADAANWDPQSVPAKGDAVTLKTNGAGTNTVTLAADVSTAMKSLSFLSAAGRTLALDGAGRTFLMPELAASEGPYAASPVVFRYADSTAYLYVDKGSEASYTNAAPMKATNAKVALTTDADSNIALSLAGQWNFYNPDGVAHASRRLMVSSGSKKVRSVFEMTGKDTTAVFPEVCVYANAKTNVLRFADGTYEIKGDFDAWPDKSTPSGSFANYGLIDVRIEDADFTVGGKTYLWPASNYAATHSIYSSCPYRFSAINSTLVTKNRYESYASSDATTYLSNTVWTSKLVPQAWVSGKYIGSCLSVGCSDTTTWTYSNVKAKLVMVDSAFYATNQFNNSSSIRVGKFDSAKMYGAIYATNSTVKTVNAISFGYGDGVFKNCTVTGNGSAFYGFPIANTSTVTFEGGTASSLPPCLSASASFTRGPKVVVDGATLSGGTSYLGYGSDLASGATQTNILHLKSGWLAMNGVCLCYNAQPAWLLLEGGTYCVNSTYGGSMTHAKSATKGGWAQMTADGGKILCNADNSAVVTGLDRVEAGPNGLTLDTNGKSGITLNQGVRNRPGTAGLFTKLGAQALKVTATDAWDVSNTVVKAGTLQMVPGSGTSLAMETALKVEPGTTFSTVGSLAALTVDSLVLSNATLALDAGDSITVKGLFDVYNLKLSFSGTPALGDTATFVFEQPLSDAARFEVQYALMTSTCPAGSDANIDFATDPETGHTTATVEIIETPVVSGVTTWQGPGTAWATAANWSAGVPTGTHTALLEKATAPKSVTVAGTQPVGVLAFGDDGYTLAGDGTLDLSAYANSRIAVTNGSHEISATVATRGVSSALDVASGSTLTLSGAVQGRGFVKTGKGRLLLGGDSAYKNATVTAKAGRLVVTGEQTLAESQVALANGTVTFPSNTKFGADGPVRLKLAPSNVGSIGGAGVIDNEADVAFTGLSYSSGCLVKKGKGRLTLDLSDGTSTVLTSSDGDHKAGGVVFNDTSAWAFSADGTPPTFGYGGLSVAGGDVLVKGDGKTTISASGSITVGTLTTTDCGEQPSLTFDNAKFNFAGNWREIVVGYRAGCNASYFLKRATLRVLNGSSISSTASLVLDGAYSADWASGVRLTLAVTNSTISLGDQFGYGESTAGRFYFSALRSRSGTGAIAGIESSNSTLRAMCYEVGGRTDSRLTATQLQGKDGGYAKFTSDQYRKGQVLFDGGTTLKVNALALTSYHANYTETMTWAFDDATWDIGTGDFSITSANCHLASNRFKLSGEGLRVAPASGKTFHTDALFYGDGGLEMSGAGTLSFGKDAYKFTGPLCVTAGTVDLSAAGTLENACIGAGAGTIVGGSFRDAVFKLGDAAPLLQNCTFENRAVVDVGDEPLAKPYPTNQTLFTFTGTAPNLSGWRLKGQEGLGLGATFTVEGNAVKVTIKAKGFVIRVR